MIHILRGIPGAGKTGWYRKNVVKNHTVFSADFFFESTGKYVFDPTKIEDAHDWCFSSYMTHLSRASMETILRRQADLEVPDLEVVVDNTNISGWEISPYYRLAEIYKLPVQIVRVHCDPVAAWKRNVHGVPLKVVLDMDKRLRDESLPPWWNEIVVPAEF